MTGVDFTQCGDLFTICCCDGTVKVFNIPTYHDEWFNIGYKRQRTVSHLSVDNHRLSSVCLAKSGDYFLASSIGGQVRLCDTAHQKVLVDYKVFNFTIS